MTANRIGSPIEHRAGQDLLTNLLDAAQAAGLQSHEFPTPDERAELQARIARDVGGAGLAEEGGVYVNPFASGLTVVLKSEVRKTKLGRRYGYHLVAAGGRVNWIVFVDGPSLGESFSVATREERDWLLAMVRLAGTAA